MSLRAKALVAIILVTALFLAFRFERSAVKDAAPVPTSPASPTVTKDVVPNPVAKPAAAETAPEIYPRTQSMERAPPTAGSAPVRGAEQAAYTVEAVAAPAAELPGQNLNARRPLVPAECWGVRGSAPRDYVVTLDREMYTSGEASALISSRRETSGYVTMFQTSSAMPVRGRRVEFSADVRTRGARGSANLLLRAEDAYGNTVAFDNMTTSYDASRQPNRLINRGVKGDTEWSTQHVVVDIPDEARVITYGLSLFESGQAWIDNARVEVVSDDLATTAIDVRLSPTPPNGIPLNPASVDRSPRNLEFDLEAQAGAQPCN